MSEPGDAGAPVLNADGELVFMGYRRSGRKQVTPGQLGVSASRAEVGKIAKQVRFMVGLAFFANVSMK